MTENMRYILIIQNTMRVMVFFDEMDRWTNDFFTQSQRIKESTIRKSSKSENIFKGHRGLKVLTIVFTMCKYQLFIHIIEHFLCRFYLEKVFQKM